MRRCSRIIRWCKGTGQRRATVVLFVADVGDNCTGDDGDDGGTGEAEGGADGAASAAAPRDNGTRSRRAARHARSSASDGTSKSARSIAPLPRCHTKQPAMWRCGDKMGEGEKRGGVKDGRRRAAQEGGRVKGAGLSAPTHMHRRPPRRSFPPTLSTGVRKVSACPTARITFLLPPPPPPPKTGGVVSGKESNVLSPSLSIIFLYS